MKKQCEISLILLLAGLLGTAAAAQRPSRISLKDAIRLALRHNHALIAAAGNIGQAQAEEITANLRPNPQLTADALYVPIFSPSHFSTNYLNNTQEFDIGVSYLWERGNKRQHRLAAAKTQTAVVRESYLDARRGLIYAVGQQFVAALLAKSSLQFARRDLASFQRTLQISQARYQAGEISEGDYLKIQLQQLQFQTDVSNAELAWAQARAGLRALLGENTLARHFTIVGHLRYVPITLGRAGLEALALKQRPDYLAALDGIPAAQAQYGLAKADAKQDVTEGMQYTHTGGVNEAGFTFNIGIPIFDRNQGEILRTRLAIGQARQAADAVGDQVLADVRTAWATVHSAAQVVKIYQTGYLQEARSSRDISAYAYQHGAVSLLNFLDAERSYRNVQLSYRQALANALLAREQMFDAVGTRKLP